MTPSQRRDPARSSVWVVAGAVVVLLLAVSGRYGVHRDEWYFLVAGERLAWGYVDQPPLVPFLARLSDLIAGGALPVLRLWPALAVGAVIVVAARTAAQLGGGRRAQLLTAIAVGSAALFLALGHLLSTATIDLLVWTVWLWLLLRLLDGAAPRPAWIGLGVVTGVGLLNKHLVVLLVLSAVIGLVAGRRLDVLRTPWLGVAIAIAGVIALPNLLWQAANGWPQIEMARSLSAKDGGVLGALGQMPFLVLTLGPALVPLWLAGARALRADPSRRALLWTWAAALVLTVVTGGKFYYPAPVFIPLLAAGAVRWEAAWGAARETGRGAARETTRGAGRDRMRVAVAWVLAGAAIGLPIALPIVPIGALDAVPVNDLNDELGETIGFPAMVRQVASVWHDLPDDVRNHAAIWTISYGEAGALERLGPDHDLPPPVSAHNSYWHWTRPADDVDTVLAVGGSEDYLRRFFTEVELLTRLEMPPGVDSEMAGAGVWLATAPRAPWSELWSQMRHYD